MDAVEQSDVPDAARHGVTEMMCDFHNILRAKFPVRRAGNRQPLCSEGDP